MAKHTPNRSSKPADSPTTGSPSEAPSAHSGAGKRRPPFQISGFAERAEQLQRKANPEFTDLRRIVEALTLLPFCPDLTAQEQQALRRGAITWGLIIEEQDRELPAGEDLDLAGLVTDILRALGRDCIDRLLPP